MRFKGDAECVRSHWAHEAVKETYHGASFVRLELVIDSTRTIQADLPRTSEPRYNPIHTSILRLTPRLKTNRNSTAILALRKTNGMDASLAPVWYRETEPARAFDIATIDCVVG